MNNGWRKSTLGKHVKIYSGNSPSQTTLAETGDFPFVKVEDLNNCGKYQVTSRSFTNEQKFCAPAGSVIFPKRGAAILNNKIRIASVDLAMDTNLMAVAAQKGLESEFLYYLVLWEGLFKIADTSTIPQLNNKHINPYSFNLPPLTEQRKIAEILRAWDEAIEKLEALRAAKELRITSTRQRLFEAAYASHNQLQRARDIFETVSERARPDLPLLAVMQDIGIVRRDQLDRRVAMPDGDTSTYKVVRPGDFVISLRSFEGGLEYSNITGLVSPAYTVLRPKAELVGDYYRHFFKSRSFIGRLDKLIFGIRDGKQIAFRDFGDMNIPAPPVGEQDTQARALLCLEADLELEDKRIKAITRQKRGLMQKLLTGEWRVKVVSKEGTAG